MPRHVFDVTESATHDLVADQLRALADQFSTGEIDLSYDDWHSPTVVTDPVDVTVDLKQQRRHVELVIRVGWTLAGGEPREPRRSLRRH